MSDYDTTHDPHTTADEQAQLWKKVAKIRFAMLTTRSADGELRSRPMTLQEVDDLGLAALGRFLQARVDVAAARLPIHRVGRGQVRALDEFDGEVARAAGGKLAHEVRVDDDVRILARA